MKVLITGAGGFIGGRLADFLQKKKYSVCLASRNIFETKKIFPSMQVVQLNWDDTDGMARILKGVDIVIHAAGLKAELCLENPAEAFKVNAENTRKLLDASVQSNIKRFVYLSTIHVYSKNPSGLINEDTPCLNDHPYAQSKIAGEKFVIESTKANKIQGIILRISNAFGAPIHKKSDCWDLLLNDLSRQAIEARTLTLKSEGLQYRDFISILDLSEKIETILGYQTNDALNFIYNLSSNKSTKVIEMTKILQQRCKALLGFLPPINLPKNSDAKIYDEFTFATKYAFLRKQNNRFEIYELDNLLKFCKENFKR
jgi:UDP-glucose 4-epimerase